MRLTQHPSVFHLRVELKLIGSFSPAHGQADAFYLAPYLFLVGVPAEDLGLFAQQAGAFYPQKDIFGPLAVSYHLGRSYGLTSDYLFLIKSRDGDGTSGGIPRLVPLRR